MEEIIISDKKTLELLDLTSSFNDKIKKCEYRPIYDLNVIDICDPDETLTSKILGKILSYKNSNGYIIFKSFCKKFLGNKGFDINLISEPEITIEKDHIDICIFEKNKYAIIIENKLKGAPFQRNQIARYICKLQKQKFEDQQIFVVILPESPNKYIPSSVWKLPADHDSPNGERKCRESDDIHCWCDFSYRDRTQEQKEHCQDCKQTWKEDFKHRTCVIHKELAEWLLSTTPIIECREKNAITAIEQFSDYLRGLYKDRINQQYIKMRVDFLREKLNLDPTNPQKSWDELERRLQEIKELEKGLEEVRLALSSELIDKWYEDLKTEWPMIDREYKKGESFCLKLEGLCIGCWYKDEEDPDTNIPIIGIICEVDYDLDTNKVPKDQEEFAKRILAACGYSTDLNLTDREGGWMRRIPTTKGEDVNKIFEAARNLSTIMFPKPLK